MLKQKLNYAWRVFGTGLGFTCFGIGGLVIGVLIAPTVKLLRKDPEQQAILTQKVIQRSFKGFIDGLCALKVMSYKVHGVEKLQQSYGELVVANHPTLLDVVMLIAFMPRANCVVKQALWTNPFTHGPVKSAGYILNHGASEFMEACVTKMMTPLSSTEPAGSLIIFPEGTRTEKGAMLNEFQRGWANIALRTHVPIRPVLISCTPSTLTKNEKWYHIPARPFHLELTVLDAIDIQKILPDVQQNPKGVRQLNTWLYDFFKHKLSK